MSTQIAYRLGDGAPVTLESARAIWTAVAREVLEQTTSTMTVRHSDLARQVQQRSGVYTRLPTGQWLPAVLDDIADAELTARVRADAPAPEPRGRTATRRAPRTPPVPTARKRQETPPAICPTCFMELPASGRCDTCS